MNKKSVQGVNFIDSYFLNQTLDEFHRQLDFQLKTEGLLQNEWGCLYTFIQPNLNCPTQFFFIDDSEYLEVFSKKHNNNFLSNAKHNTPFRDAFVAKLRDAMYTFDESYLSPKVFQRDAKNLYIKIDASQCILIREKTHYCSEGNVVEFIAEMTKLSYPVIHLLPASKIYTINSNIASYIQLIINKEDFITQEKSKKINRSMYKFPNSDNDVKNNENNINYLIEKVCQGKPTDIETNRITGFLNKFNVHEDYHACLLTWMIHALMPSAHQIALQIIGPRDSGKSSLQRFLKAVIDPGGEDGLEIPKTSKSLHKHAFQNHLLCYDEVEEFKSVVEKDMEKILHGTHINVDHLYKKGQQMKTVKVRRPIIWNSLTNVVTHPKLQERVLTISLPDNKFSDENFKIDAHDTAYCMAFIIQSIREVIDKFKSTSINDKLRYPPAFEDFIKIGNCKFPDEAEGTGFFSLEDELHKLFLTQTKLAISSSVVGDALLTFISTHDKKDYTFKMIEWSEKLESYKASGVKWHSEPNKVGAELDKLAHQLMLLGVEIYQSNEQGERLEPGTVRSNYYRTLTFLEHYLDHPTTSQ